jgi:hypothetical protein
MVTFALRGRVADLDETTADEPWHPAVVLLLEVDEGIWRVILPSSALNGQRERLCVGRPVAVFGELHESPRGLTHVASQVRLGAGH